jgi:SAM-dependent methyltransferase
MIDFSEIRDICDMGCGPATICLELMRKHSHLRALLIDYNKEALDIALADAVSAKIQDRIEMKRQELSKVAIEKKFDMVILSLVLCLLSREDAVRLLGKAKAALRPGGTLILGEILLGSSGTSALKAALFAVHLLVTGSQGGLFSLDDIREMLRDSGLRYDRHFPANQYHIVVGKNELD